MNETFHELRTDPVYFDHVWTGDKPFEVRWDDRGYQRGDELLLREWDPETSCDRRVCVIPAGRAAPVHEPDCLRYTGREVSAIVGFILSSTAPRGRQPGFSGKGYVVLGLTSMRNQTDEKLAAAHAAWPSKSPGNALIESLRATGPKA